MQSVVSRSLIALRSRRADHFANFARYCARLVFTARCCHVPCPALVGPPLLRLAAAFVFAASISSSFLPRVPRHNFFRTNPFISDS
jgi:hypothetical protein